jgi:dihydrofolate synthase/folylpolyglutamate synthase
MIENAMKFIYGTTWKGSVLGLERITELMRLLGDPKKSLKFVHIAGTNGKGSTAAMLASVLAEAGYKTGLYTSPFLENFNELIQINGKPISDEEIIALVAEMQPIAAKMPDAPTEYEIITAMALLHYYKSKCDIIVLEVGMGGRLDSTNVIDTPEVAVITAIGLDHMAQLGGTVEKIAGEKAGIIKGGTAVCHPQTTKVAQVIRAKCEATNTSLTFVEKPVQTACSLSWQRFVKNDYEYTIPLLGEHQLTNAAVAIEAIQKLRAIGWKVPDSALREGLAKTTWPGRFEILRESPIFIADVSHNPQGIQATISTLLQIFPDKKFTFLFGVLADKEYEKMLRLLSPHAEKFIFVTPENPRALPAKELLVYVKNGAVCDTIEEGVNLALQSEIICALGSLSMIGKIRRTING